MRRSILVLMSALLALPAAATDTGGTLPWNTPLKVLKENITGPTATALVFIAIAIALAAWAFAPDNRWIFTAAKGVIALAVISALGAFFTALSINAATL